MKFKARIILFFSWMMLFHVLPGFAGELDIFKSHRAFPVGFKYLPDRIPDIESLAAEEVEDVLRHYLKVAEKSQNREEKNLYNLAVGYLYLKKGDYKKAASFLQNNIIGNFILDDFRINFQAEALKELARQKLEKKKFATAADYLRKSIFHRLKIYKSFPDSLFYSSLPRDLAETELLLGNVYYQSNNYKAAWQAYRKTLMRKFPDNKEHRLLVYLALAKTYESANDLQQAVDIHVHLSSRFGGPVAKEAARAFLKKNESNIQKKNISADKLIAAYTGPETDKSTNGTTKLPEKMVSLKSFANHEIRKFYEGLGQGDYSKIIRQANVVLRDFPGTEFTGDIIKNVNRMTVDYLKDHSWNADIGKVTDFYPAPTLRALAYDFWRNLNPDAAAILYNKILRKYPLEIESCHKALFFLGRIYEDKGDYGKALQFYNRLLKQYNSGPYTTAALFKIPWIERLDGQPKEAEKHFKSNIDFYASKQYESLLAAFPKSPSFVAASRFWMARTAERLKNPDEKKFQFEKLIEESPFDFYAVIARAELGLSFKEFLGKEIRQPLAKRMAGLGESENKHLKRAEKLITAGFMRSGILELKLVADNSMQDLPFMFYLSRLFYLAGDYHKSIKLVWGVVDQEKIEFVSTDLSKNLFPAAYLKKVESLAAQFKVDPLLILSLIRQESGFDSKIVSSANAVGLMQLMEATAKQVAGWKKNKAPDFEALKNPQVNLLLGIAYLRRLLSTFDHKTFLALAAYNAGPHKVKEWTALRTTLSPLEFVESIPYRETRDYVKKVLRNYCVYLALYKDKDIKRFKEILTNPRG